MTRVGGRALRGPEAARRDWRPDAFRLSLAESRSFLRLCRAMISSVSLSRAAALSLVVGFALSPSELFGQPRTVASGVLFQSGSALVSPLTGIGFTVPDGFAGQWDPEGDLLAFQSETVLGGVWGWSEGTVEDAASEVEARLGDLGVQLSPRDDVQVGPDALTGTFDALTADGRAVLSAEIRQGPQGQVVAVAALAEGPSSSDGFVDAVVSTLDWSVPGAAQWRPEVEGAVLRWTGGGSDMSGGVTTATGASQSEATLAFCSGFYRYRESSESYVSIDGVSASSSSSDEHAGEWYLVADLIGAPTLYLFANDGRVFEWSVEESGEGFLIDGYLYRPAGGC